jgi:hypothetical protein
MKRSAGSGRTALAALLLLAAAGCTGGVPSQSALPVATSADEFAAAWCSSLEALARAIGNPDTAADSKLSAALDSAITRADYAGVDETAARMRAELATGRQLASVAAGWTPGAAVAGQVDALLRAVEVLVETKRANAARGLGEADRMAQAAFEEAGGIEAWQGMFEAARGLPDDATARLDCRWWEAGAPD